MKMVIVVDRNIETGKLANAIAHWVIPPFLTEVISRIRPCVEYVASA